MFIALISRYKKIPEWDFCPHRYFRLSVNSGSSSCAAEMEIPSVGKGPAGGVNTGLGTWRVTLSGSQGVHFYQGLHHVTDAF